MDNPPEGATFLRVKNWQTFQHYKQRNPPWIRLYNALLDDYTFTRLQDASKWHAVGLWLLASRFDNRIPDDVIWIAQRISARTPIDINELLSSGFVERCDSASGMLASCKQVAMPEESRGETETEKNSDATHPASRKVEKLSTFPQSTPEAIPSTIKDTAAKVASAPVTSDVSDSELMGLIRARFYVPDGKPPPRYDEAREFTMFAYLREHGYSGREIAERIEGAALIRDDGGRVNGKHDPVSFLQPDTKLTMRALVNCKSGTLQLWNLAGYKLEAVTSENGKGKDLAGGRIHIEIKP